MGKHEERRYIALPDTESSDCALVLNAKTNPKPETRRSQYHKLVIAEEEWFVHRSFLGILTFLIEVLGEGNIGVDDEGEIKGLTVPKDKVGFRIQVTSAHTDEQIDHLLAVLTDLAAEGRMRPAHP